MSLSQSEWEELVARALEPIAADNPYQIMQPGEISAIHSVNHTQGSYGLDSRPKIYDKAAKTWILCDTGSCICIPKEPGDELDSKLSLKPVNGGVNIQVQRNLNSDRSQSLFNQSS